MIPSHPVLPLSLTTSVMGFGSTGMSVKVLQEFLNQRGFTVAASGPGSAGSETDYFGARTKAALAKFQATNGITPAAGYFGPITRAYVAHLVGTGTGASIETGSVTYQGTVACLPHRGATSTMECAFGLTTASGAYYALDLAQIPNASLETGAELAITGMLEASSTQTARLMQQYAIQGVVQVKNIAPATALSHASDLANGAYSFMGDTFALANGSTTIQGHSGLATADSAALVPVSYTLAATTTGDVDGDGSADTVAALYRGFGANLQWVLLFAFSPDGTQIASSTAYAYDSKVQSVSVQDGVVTLTLLVVSAADRQHLPHYEQVPNQPLASRFSVSKGTFVPIAGS
jgi:hypothetical protein